MLSFIALMEKELYEEMEVLTVLTDESLILDIDIIEKRHEDEIAALKKRIN